MRMVASLELNSSRPAAVKLQPCRGPPSRVTLPHFPTRRAFYRGEAAPEQVEVSATTSGGSGGGGNDDHRKHTGDGDDENGTPASHSTELPLAFAVLCSLLHAAPAYALVRRKKKVLPKKGLMSADVDRLVDLSWPLLENLGFSGVVGVITGVALKAVGRGLALVLGVIFGSIQVGAYFGYIEVDWARVHRDIIQSFDVNDDGKFDISDFRGLVASSLAVLSQGVPSIGGFCLGFGLGLRL